MLMVVVKIDETLSGVWGAAERMPPAQLGTQTSREKRCYELHKRGGGKPWKSVPLAPTRRQLGSAKAHLTSNRQIWT